MGEKKRGFVAKPDNLYVRKKAERIRLFNEKQKKGGRYRPPL